VWKSFRKLIEAKRPEQEVRDDPSKLQLALTLAEKHENYSRLLEDDGEFEVQEGWMGECQEDYVNGNGCKSVFGFFPEQGKDPVGNL